MNKKTVRDIDVAGKRVLVRVDFNVPLDAERHITDDTRIRASLPTIQYLLENGAAVILMSHLGRPKGEVNKKYSLAPVAQRLSELLGTPVQMAPDVLVLKSRLKHKRSSQERSSCSRTCASIKKRRRTILSSLNSWPPWVKSMSTMPLALHIVLMPRRKGLPTFSPVLLAS